MALPEAMGQCASGSQLPNGGEAMAVVTLTEDMGAAEAQVRLSSACLHLP